MTKKRWSPTVDASLGGPPPMTSEENKNLDVAESVETLTPPPPNFWETVGDAHPGLTIIQFRGAYRIGECGVADGSDPLLVQIEFQSGPVKEVGGHNGVSVESLLVVVLHRLEQYQASEYACDENVQAIRKIQSGLDALDARTAKRTSRGVEGTNKL